MVALVAAELLGCHPAAIVAVPAIALLGSANQCSVLLDQVQDPLLGVVRRALDRNQFDAFLILVDVVLPLRFVVFSLGLVHNEHNAVIDSRKVALLQTGWVELEPGLADVSLAQTCTSLR